MLCDADNCVGGDNQHISDAYNGALTVIWWCCSNLYAIGVFNLRESSCGVASSVADISSSCRFSYYQHLNKSADFFNIVEANVSKQHGVFDSKYSQNRQSTTKSKFLVKQ